MLLSNNTFKNGFHKFCDATSMHGWQELYYAKAKFWTFVWILACVGSLILTFIQVYNATVQYANSASITQVSNLDPGELMLPNLSVCYINWLYWADWKKGFGLGFTREQLLYSFSVLNVIYSPTVFNVTEAKQGLVRQMTINNITGLGQLFQTIAKPIPLVVGELTSNHLDPNPFLDEIKFIFKTDRIYLCYSLSGEKIKKMLADQKKSSSSARTNGNTLSFSIQDPEYKYFSEYLSAEEYSYNMAHWLMYYSNYWVDDFTRDYTNFALPIRLYTDSSSNDFAELITENDAYSISAVASVHRWMNTADSQCYEDQKTISTADRCGDLCLATFQKKDRKCYDLDQAIWNNADMPDNVCLREIKFIPLLTQNWTSTLATDTVAMSTTVATSTVTAQGTLNATKQKWTDEYNNCTNNCVYACEIWKYDASVSIKTVASIVRKVSFKNATDIRIVYPDEGDILIMIEIDARTWEDFVANVGGLLGVWTGASLLSFLQVFYLCCCTESSCDCCNYKRKRVASIKTTDVEIKEVEVEESPIDDVLPTDPRKVHKKAIQQRFDDFDMGKLNKWRYF